MREFFKLIDMLNPARRFGISQDLDLISERVKARLENEDFQRRVDEYERQVLATLTDHQRALRAAFSSSSN